MSRLYALSLKSNNLFGTIPSQICRLESLQILDLSFNNLHGTIPPCVNNLTSMVQKGFFLEQNKHHYSVFINSRGFIGNSYIDHLLIAWQGKVNEFNSILGLLKAVDLSSNNLTGQIPNEVTNLHGLNMFLEEMPSSMSDMHSLNDLDVSFNNLSGRVPSSTQLQSFEPRRFTGNAGLCGLPTTKKCPEDEYLGVPHVVKSGSDGYSTDELQRWFYVGWGNLSSILGKLDTQQTTPFLVSSPRKCRAGINDFDSLKFTYKVMNFLLRVKRAKFVLDEARRWVWKTLSLLSQYCGFCPLQDIVSGERMD
ncbi:leucine-rich repeat-containing protein [Tanacetum coccineum]